MRISRYLAATSLAAVLFVVLPPSIVAAKDPHPAKQADARQSQAVQLSAGELQHKLQTEAGERASRSRPPSPLTSAPNNGIVQIPIDTTKTYLEPKGNINPWNSSLRVNQLNVESRHAQSGGHPPPPPPPPCFFAPGFKTASLVKAFAEVTWHVCIEDVGVKGLWVGPVDIKRTPSSPWMRVIYLAGLADIFVPYHDNSLRFYDMRWTQWLDQVFALDAGPNGSLITLTNEAFPTVVAEVRDRGTAYLCKENGNNLDRRGQELVVWGVSDAGNYDNIVQISFRDDGSMGFRMGNTGFNSQPHALTAHAHNALWRVDMDLNGFGGDSAYWVTHSEPTGSLTATDSTTAFGTEGARQWDYSQYASLLIEDSSTNVFGHKLGYEFTPAELGMSRHYDWKEDWTHNDAYVTTFHSNEFGWLNTWTTTTNFNWASPDDYLLTYLNGEITTNNDLVVWIKSAAHHDPSDEDRSINDVTTLNSNSVTGVTLIHWSGFDIEPHNLFDDNPLGGPVMCQ